MLGVYDYQSAAVTGGGHLSEVYGFSRDFDHFQAPRDWGSFFHTVPAAFDWLDQRDTERPFFLFLHGYDAHNRYLKPAPLGTAEFPLNDDNPPRLQRVLFSNNGTGQVVNNWFLPGLNFEDVLTPTRIKPRTSTQILQANPELTQDPHASQLSTEELGRITAAYAGAVRYLDAWLGLVMAKLDARGLLENTVVVLIADHGEELGERGFFNHRHALSEEILHVPLMVRLPGGEGGGRRIAQKVALLDVMPTLLEAAGAQIPAQVHGHSLWPALQGGEAPERALLFSEGASRMMHVQGDTGGLTFYGLGPHSPYLLSLLKWAQLDGLAFDWSPGLLAAEAGQLRDALWEWRTSLHFLEFEQSQISDAQKARLREQGYWSP